MKGPQMSSYLSACALRGKTLTPYSLVNCTLSQLQFGHCSRLQLVDATPLMGAPGLMFAINGGYAICPGRGEMYQDILRAVAAVLQLPGGIGIYHGAVAQHPVFSSALTVKTQVGHKHYPSAS